MEPARGVAVAPGVVSGTQHCWRERGAGPSPSSAITALILTLILAVSPRHQPSPSALAISSHHRPHPSPPACAEPAAGRLGRAP